MVLWSAIFEYICHKIPLENWDLDISIYDNKIDEFFSATSLFNNKLSGNISISKLHDYLLETNEEEYNSFCIVSLDNINYFVTTWFQSTNDCDVLDPGTLCLQIN